MDAPKLDGPDRQTLREWAIKLFLDKTTTMEQCWFDSAVRMLHRLGYDIVKRVINEKSTENKD